MKKIITLLMMGFLLMAIFAFAQPEKVRVFLEFKGKPNVGAVALSGGKVLHSYGFVGNVLAVELPVNALAGVLQNPNVVGYELDVEVHALGKDKCSPWPSCKGGEDPAPEPSQVLPWGVDRIDAELSANSGSGVTVCVVDTGIDKDHPDLNVAGGKNFVKKGKSVDPNKWDDDEGHGTHVAGTIAALDNSIGVVGVAPQASLLAAKVLDRRGSGYLSDVMAGIEYCVNSGAEVISMSLGTSSNVQAMHDTVNAAYASGALLIAAAGNDYGAPVLFPAAYNSVVAVAATDEDDNLAVFNSLGPEIELVAPGVSILSTTKGGGYGLSSGTSMATPHVSGAAALAMEQNPLLSNVEIRNLLVGTADMLSNGFLLVDAELN